MTDLRARCRAALDSPESRPAVEYEGHWHTWGDMKRVAEDLLRGLGDDIPASSVPVALVARNRPSALAAFVALLSAGHSIRMVYPFQSTEAMLDDIQAIGPGAVVAAREDLAGPLLDRLHQGGAAAVALTEMNAELLLPAARQRRAGSRPVADSGGTGPRVDILTSGTTGKPKPFGLDYPTIARHIVGATPSRKDREEQPPALLMFPVSNISGLYSTLPPLLNGQPAVLLDRFTVAGWHDYILRYRPAVAGLPPAGIQMILDADIPAQDLAGLRAIGTGAAPLDPGIQRAFEARYGIPILLSYGATEFGGPVARMTPELQEQWGARKFGSVGRALPGCELRIVDTDNGRVLPPGEEGRLEVISARIGPGWIRTTDLAILDEDGFLFHRGRTDGAIVRGGFKLRPAAIEQALLTHQAVSQAVVVGLPDKRLGQVPAAVVEYRAGTRPAPSFTELEAHLRQQLPATHIPTAWQRVETMPRTPSMKVDLRAVRQLFRQGDQ